MGSKPAAFTDNGYSVPGNYLIESMRKGEGYTSSNGDSLAPRCNQFTFCAKLGLAVLAWNYDSYVSQLLCIHKYARVLSK